MRREGRGEEGREAGGIKERRGGERSFEWRKRGRVGERGGGREGVV